MSATAAISAVVAISLVTYASRAGLIVFLADRPVPAEMSRALRYVAPAVLSALTVNLLAGGEGIDGVEFADVTAILVGVGVAWWRRNLIASLLAGMATLWIVLALS